MIKVIYINYGKFLLQEFFSEHMNNHKKVNFWEIIFLNSRNFFWKLEKNKKREGALWNFFQELLEFFLEKEKKGKVLEKCENTWKILSGDLSPNITPKIGRGAARGYGGRGGA